MSPNDLKEAMLVEADSDDVGGMRAISKGVRPLSSVIKTLAVLDLLASYDRPVRLAEVARSVQGNRSTIYQKLITLVAAGWVEQVDHAAFRLTLQASKIGEAALEQASLGARSFEILRELSLVTGETATLAVVSGMHVQVIRRVEAESNVVANSQLSFAESSSGRVLTAFVSASYRDVLREKGAKLESEDVLQEVVANGYAISSGKDVPGVQSVAAPVMSVNQCVAAIAVVAPASRFNPKVLVEPLKSAAARMSAFASGNQFPSDG